MGKLRAIWINAKANYKEEGKCWKLKAKRNKSSVRRSNYNDNRNKKQLVNGDISPTWGNIPQFRYWLLAAEKTVVFLNTFVVFLGCYVDFTIIWLELVSKCFAINTQDFCCA